MPCAWDAFSAMLFERCGFHCMGTTSGGVNWVGGRRDYVYSTPSDAMLNSYVEIAKATSLPVSGNLENGDGATPQPITLTMLEDIGIRRVSTGGGLTRATFAYLEKAATQIMYDGTFDYLRAAFSEADVHRILIDPAKGN